MHSFTFDINLLISVTITGIIKVYFAYNPDGHVPRFGPAEVWTTLHVGLAIVCACLPILKPLFARMTGNSAFSTLTSRSGSVDPRRNASEPDGWNIIHLSVGKTEQSEFSLAGTPSIRSFDMKV